MKIYPRFLLNIASGLVAATLLSLTTSSIAFWSIAQTNESNRLVQKTLNTINRINSVIQNIKDAESGQRGYLLSEDKAYQQAYINATLSIEKEIPLLKQLLIDKPDQQNRLSKLENLVSARIAQLQQVLNIKNQQNLEAARFKLKENKGYLLTEKIRRITLELQTVQTETLLQQQKYALVNAQNARIAFILAIVINLLIFAWLYKLIYQEVLKRNRVEQQIMHLNEDLEQRVVERTEQLETTLRDLQQTQGQLVQQEKMSSLGQLVAGVAHEINNPVNFIHGNLQHVQEYSQNLLDFLQLYQKHYPNPAVEIQACAEEIDLDFLRQDLMKILSSMRIGTNRIREIVLSLRTFSRMDEAEFKIVNIHENIESTLMILQHRLKAKPERPEIELIRDYGELPNVECFAGQLNQVFMNILSNAIDALEEFNAKRSYQEIETNPNRITIHTSTIGSNWVKIAIADNGCGIPEAIKERIFDPFFTTKPVGKGTGMGMSISYQIITQKHNGKIKCFSTPGEGTEFIIEIPIQQK
ncbi:MAG: CHASE3 domain-containing protein [Calothrix sp. C42_A2020_038]|nr:CHASE3 domain-containing protein [Calothrix sp. C42_A2020_038]